MNWKIILLLIVALHWGSCGSDNEEPDPPVGLLQMVSLRVGTNNLSAHATIIDLPPDQPIVATFSQPIKRENANNIKLFDENNQEIPLTYSFLDQDKTVSAIAANPLDLGTQYSIQIGPIESIEGAVFGEATFNFRTRRGQLSLQSLTIDEENLMQSGRVQNISFSPIIKATFSHPVVFQDPMVQIRHRGIALSIDIEQQDDGRTLVVTPSEELDYLLPYELVISDQITSSDDRIFQGYTKTFYTQLDSTFKFPQLSDEELLTLVQLQTFGYFWEFAHGKSGMARERNTSGDLVTSGGSGFGLMAIIVGIERGFISREDGLLRLNQILDFLEAADRFHGAWSHWIDGNSGAVIPFSQRDDGGDLVETSFMIQGLITFRQYLDPSNPTENVLIARINHLWEDVEWNWYTKGENVLYWHWSPNHGWEMNLPIRGYNESLITYVLAASSPTHPIEADVYHQGWARNGNMRNGRDFYGINLPLGYDYGGPLFFAHYSFLGLDPRNLQDEYADYWEQNVNHSVINWSYSADNPNNYVGYSEDIWGLTASDNQNGYSAHSPTNDLGVITPTAAISSIPYTPEQSMDAIRSFYYYLGDRLWGPYGFYDAFNPTAGWYANSYLAIDQGPIIVMIENYRTGLLWDLFMSAPEIQEGLLKLGFN
jgi:hypothetical protein